MARSKQHLKSNKRKIDLVEAGGRQTEPPAAGGSVPYANAGGPFGMLLLSAPARARFRSIRQHSPYSTRRVTRLAEMLRQDQVDFDRDARLEERLNQDRMLTATDQERINAGRMLDMERRIEKLAETVDQLEQSHAQLMVSHALQLEESYGQSYNPVHDAPRSAPSSSS